MKLIIQIPCFNEEQFLPVTLSQLPRQIDGIDEIGVLVIDDGSSDRTVEVARDLGAEVIPVGHHQGLAGTFMVGIRACLERGADIIVNTDADNQYDARDIPALIRPILENKVDIVIGARPIETIRHFSLTKKVLQRVGSAVVAFVSGTRVQDAPSGFRAISRHAAMSMNVFDPYTYTLETLIQAGQKHLRVASVPIRVNADLRPSRLVRSVPSYVFRSIKTIVRFVIIYRPFRFFFRIGVLIFVVGVLIGARFVVYYVMGHGEGHVQSLILGSLCMMMGFQTVLLAVLADLLSVNRRLIEDIQRYQREHASRHAAPPSLLPHRAPDAPEAQVAIPRLAPPPSDVSD